MSRVEVSQAVVIWVAGRALYPVARKRWAGLRREAEGMLRQSTPGRCLVGRGAFRDHAVYHVLGFTAICGQPVDSVTGGDMPGDITCWTCLIRLRKASGRVVQELEAARGQAG